MVPVLVWLELMRPYVIQSLGSYGEQEYLLTVWLGVCSMGVGCKAS